MKTLFTLCILAVLLLASTGCVNTSKLVDSLSKDPATLHMTVTTIYGTVSLTRANPGTNTIPHTVDADGRITVGEDETKGE